MEKINPNQNTKQSALTGAQSWVASDVSNILNQERKHPELDIRRILTINPIAMDYYSSNRITEEDIPFLEEAKDSLTKDHSIENFEKISMNIPKKRLDIGWILSFIYAQLNQLKTRDPIVIRSLRHYHPDFKNLSAHDVETLEQVLGLFEKNENSTEVLLQGINMVPEDMQNMRDAVVLLFYSVMFDGSFIFSRDLSMYKD